MRQLEAGRWAAVGRSPHATPRAARVRPQERRHASLFASRVAWQVGVFKNCFGDANSLVRRDVFLSLGGFTEDEGVGHEDWELWARAVLQGHVLQVVPEALYWYRLTGGGMLSESLGGSHFAQAQRFANHARNIRPYLESLAGWPEAQDIVRLAQGMYLSQGAAPTRVKPHLTVGS